MKNREKTYRFRTETKTGDFGTRIVTAKHPRGLIPVKQFLKPEPAVPNHNRRFLNREHLYIGM